MISSKIMLSKKQ